MLRHGTIICLSSIDWAFNWQIPQEVMTGLAAQGNRVLFIETTGVRRPGIRDTARLAERLRNWWRASGRPRPVAERVAVCSPLLIPLPYSRLACWVNSRLLLRAIRRWMGEEVQGPVIFFTFVPTPLAHAVRDGLQPALVVYYCADRLAESSSGAGQLRAHEHAFFAAADIVFTTSSGLLRHASTHTSRAQLLTSGVRFHDFQRLRRGDDRSAITFANVRRPIVGFVGSIREELDLALIARVARRAPDLTFVLAGPAVADTRELRACANVVLAGPVPHSDAIRYMLAFDAAILPYVVNAYTSDLMPVKLKEFLAAGLPIVSTRLPEVCRFAALHAGLVRFAATDEAFVDALRQALEDAHPSTIERRLEVAGRYDWSAQMAAINLALVEALSRRAEGRLEAV
jgi:glycosyltransferase involved in cell wall biosynthesis